MLLMNFEHFSVAGFYLRHESLDLIFQAIKCICTKIGLHITHCLIGLVVNTSVWRVENLSFDSRLCRGDFTLKSGTPVATLPGIWCYRANAGTDWPVVSILWLGEVEKLISVAACKLVWADPPPCCWDVKQPTNKKNSPVILSREGTRGCSPCSLTGRKLLICQLGWFVCLFVGCLTSKQHASVSQGWICSGNFTSCHTEIEVADQTCYLT